MKLGSEEYLREVQRRTNEDEEYRRLARDEHESYTLILLEEPNRGVLGHVLVGFQVDGGELVDIWSGERKTDFVLSGRYGTWVDILRGKLGPTRAFLMRKLRVRGSMMRLLKTSDSTMRWVEILRTIPTEFEGDYAKHDLVGAG